ncbi:hypothetical protein PRIO_5111 [Paenibacillus riograndensis SBR5]|uniref:Uncharacterized protein n=1 Tax=Paenibacillus riograndensis SBR5 TaxID=1073571 RepID=A0A0E4HCU5_9BACL|nr:hypothetical protein PRIO_5111 [Paenibacillus riograndensis SBR5]
MLNVKKAPPRPKGRDDARDTTLILYLMHIRKGCVISTISVPRSMLAARVRDNVRQTA